MTSPPVSSVMRQRINTATFLITSPVSFHLSQFVLQKLGLQSQRVRDLPAEALVYYVIALGLFMAVSTGEVLRSLVEGLQWLGGNASGKLKIAGKAAISQARSRLGMTLTKV